MVTVFHYTPVNTKQFDGLNIDGLAGKYQKRQNFPRQSFALYGIWLLSCPFNNIKVLYFELLLFVRNVIKNVFAFRIQNSEH